MSGAQRPGRLPPEFADALARRAGRLGGFASRVVWYDIVSSTNDEADRLATGGAEHGTVVAADHQPGLVSPSSHHQGGRHGHSSRHVPGLRNGSRSHAGCGADAVGVRK